MSYRFSDDERGRNNNEKLQFAGSLVYHYAESHSAFYVTHIGKNSYLVIICYKKQPVLAFPEGQKCMIRALMLVSSIRIPSWMIILVAKLCLEKHDFNHCQLMLWSWLSEKGFSM